MTVTADELIWHIHEHTIPAALSLLPGRMDSPAARAMLLSIGLQESGFAHRVQVPNGPAHGFWQFEKRGGVRAVLTHALTKPVIYPVLDLLAYWHATALKEIDVDICYDAIKDNDVLACVFARLLLWTDPRALPTELEPAKGWQQYVSAWKPGRPRRETWDTYFADGWRLVKGA